MRKKLLTAVLTFVLAGGMMAGCTSPAATEDGAEAPGEEAKAASIVVLVPNADHGWTGAVLNYAKEEAQAVTAGGKYEVTVQAATDAKNQQEQIDDLLGAAQAPAGIVILPYDNTMETSMAKVAAANVPFVMFDRIIENPAVQEAVLANVKGDNEGIGLATAERFAADGLQPGDKVYVMIGDTSSVPQMRNQGFQDGLKAAGWTDEQLAGIEYSGATGWSRSTGKQIFIDWMNSHSVDEINQYHYIFTHDDELGMGILEALAGTEIDQAKKDAFVNSVNALGTSSGLNEMYQVLKGEHANTAYPDIVKNFDLFSVTYDPGMIKTAIQDMVQHLDGADMAKEHTVEVNVVDAKNVNEFQGF